MIAAGSLRARHAAHQGGSQGGQELAGNQPGFPRKCVCSLLEDLIQSICSYRICMHIFQELAFSYGKKRKGFAELKLEISERAFLAALVRKPHVFCKCM